MRGWKVTMFLKQHHDQLSPLFQNLPMTLLAIGARGAGRFRGARRALPLTTLAPKGIQIEVGAEERVTNQFGTFRRA